jgi:hypothetical protein
MPAHPHVPEASDTPRSGRAGGTGTGGDEANVSREDESCVLVLDQELPRWLAANATAVLGVALGAHRLISAGPDLLDAEGSSHPGIGVRPLPILSASRDELPALRRKALESQITVIDFNDAARNSRVYDEYETRLLSEDLGYLGLALYGPRKAVKSLSGNLRSLR